jgi:hypothetical protein
VLHELVTKLKECDIDFWQLNETNKIQLILDSTTMPTGVFSLNFKNHSQLKSGSVMVCLKGKSIFEHYVRFVAMFKI